MNKKEYNKIVKQNRKKINNDFVLFLKQNNIFEHFKNNIICGFTFEEVTSSGDPKLYFSLYTFHPENSARDNVVIIENWKRFLVEKYNLEY